MDVLGRLDAGTAPPAPPPEPGLTPEQAELVVSRLSALAQAARVFGSGVAGADLDIGWSPPGTPERMVWITGEGGRRRVEIRLDLERMVGAVRPDREGTRGEQIEGFQSAFLHELGHVLYSSHAPGEPLLDDARIAVLADGLPEEARTLSQCPRIRGLLNQIGEILEDARIERRLNDRFRGASRYLGAHAAEALTMAKGDVPSQATAAEAAPDAPPSDLRMPVVLGVEDIAALEGCAGSADDSGRVPGAPGPALSGGEVPVFPTAGPFRPGARAGRELAQLVAVLFLQIWGADDRVPTDELTERAAEAAERLRTPLLEAAAAEDAAAFSDWLVTGLLAELSESFSSTLELLALEPGSGRPESPTDGPRAESGEEEQDTGGERTDEEETTPDIDSSGSQPAPGEAPGPAGEAVDMLAAVAERLSSPGLLGQDALARVAGSRDERRDSPLRTRIILYPAMNGSQIVDEVPVATARLVSPTVQSRQVLEQVVSRYGPPALEAFAAERAALRRAFEVNFERRFAGRYFSGRRVGTRNLRRLAVSNDLRLFQRMEVPDRLSYYFHLLIDVSPSMLTDRNAAKAIAVGYAFAESLDRLRVPVDVSLYSAAVTELYDHGRDRLDRFFGGDFGYYSSGTHEIEAIAYAKLKADAVDQTRKLIVVVTDGHPNSIALSRAGATDLRAYYREALTPWLRRAGVDLLAIGIGHSPAYHQNAVSIGSSWQSIGVFMRLLDGVVAEGRRSHAELWQ